MMVVHDNWENFKTVRHISDLANETIACVHSAPCRCPDPKHDHEGCYECLFTNTIVKYPWARRQIHSPRTICGMCVQLGRECPGWANSEFREIHIDDVAKSFQAYSDIHAWEYVWKRIYVKNLKIKEELIEVVWKIEMGEDLIECPDCLGKGHHNTGSFLMIVQCETCYGNKKIKFWEKYYD